MMGTVISEMGREVPRFVPKVHAFYNQGSELRGCLTGTCGYLSDSGEATCPKCDKEGRGTLPHYILCIFAVPVVRNITVCDTMNKPTKLARGHFRMK
jgi:hypothetical protein